MEERLKKSEEKYRLLAEHVKDHVWLLDMNLKPMYVSPSAEKASGYTLAELEELTLDKLLTAESLQRSLEMFSVHGLCVGGEKIQLMTLMFCLKPRLIF